MGSVNYTGEKEFLAALARRDRKSFDLLYDRYGPTIFHFIQKCMLVEHHTDEVFKMVIAEIWENLSNFQDTKQTFSDWVMSLTGRVIHRYLKQKPTETTAEGQVDQTSLFLAKEIINNIRKKSMVD
ncbi:RNA polymerase sigma factor [Sphingobacterium griseoflavum]|uniref:RNA polymerase sigma-70 region 2 domain-containing protein n=1 Tax=Sphingobacterium griseoflavum TaxID=1474952 RepID=A0ABQ3HUW7_9SPHI|nr:hypothetical protein [Sphingobacterium griseoflavum]GHE36010.1 hypothetical protein GCM10017764_19220 [Sphingobacterium griseoflavum]